MRDYFKLVGMECTDGLRERLDRSLHILRDATPERYAEFSRTYTGDCPMLRPDGLCMLQRECGEDALSAVCRYYPRSPRTLHADECALSASCERVCEQLFEKTDRMRFVKVPLEFAYELPKRSDDGITRFYVPVRKLFVSALQNREYTLSERLAFCEKLASVLRAGFAERGISGMERALEECSDLTPERAANESVTRGFKTAAHMLSRLAERYPIERYAATCAESEYGETEKEFLKRFPKWEIMCEQVLVNHVFYDGFPFYGDLRYDIYHAFAALAALYAVWKVSAVCSLARKGDMNALVALTSELFRMAENSNFNISAAALLANGGEIEKSVILPLCAL